MTSESLSQNEIDLLFGGGGPATNVAQPPREKAQDVQVYDFRRPARISKDRKRSLMAMYGLLAKSIEGWLSGRVRDQLELNLQSVEQLTFGEFMLALPSPCASYIVDVGDTGHQGVIDFGHEFGFFLVDRLLGGAGSHQVPERTLTPIERLLVRLVADRIAAQLGEVWKDYVKLDLDVSGFESIPEMLQVANREDPVLVANIGVEPGRPELAAPAVPALRHPGEVLHRHVQAPLPERARHAGGADAGPPQPRARAAHVARQRRRAPSLLRDAAGARCSP